MFDDSRGFLSRAYLEREWALDYKGWKGSEEEAALLARLLAWADRADLRERSAVAPFVQTFFLDTWGYEQSGRGGEWTAYQEYPVAGAGAGGAQGSADLALGFFDMPHAVPQVLCEFKDIRSDLDKPQPRKGNDRSPVRQALDYVAGVKRSVQPYEPIQPWWGLVSDMNEFRLYWWDRAPEHLRFVIKSRQPLYEPSLIDATEAARFDRFVFAKLFHRDQLLSRGGRPALLRLVDRQIGREKELEGTFYADYKGVREQLFEGLRRANPAFGGTQGQLLRLAQKILDRFIFAFYCEDMGERMLFPPQLIRDTLIDRSMEGFFDQNGEELWAIFRRLFRAMDEGGPFGQRFVLRQFNGGLFREDGAVDALNLPNWVFCMPSQGANEASIKAHPKTLLHLCASYNYAARGAATESIGLYTLGRIFEQSITELEVIEARLDNRLSLNVEAKRKLPKRKRDGVYYTPEWVVNRIVDGVMNPWFAAAKAACGWVDETPASLDQLAAYLARVEAVRVVDPACGSGAFLIGAFRRLLRERLEIEGRRGELQPGYAQASEATLTAAILDRNLHGVDISGAAVEIAKLALWLHSARADAPLSSLDGAILCGNSLVGPDFYRGEQHDGFTARQREQVNAFDWEAAFPFGGDDPGRFDIVLGNPPYVKLQNLRKVDPEVADYLMVAREGGYASTQTGNFDLYLPFIEKGLRLLRANGRMGYIAPSLWAVNEYGQGLRRLIRQGRNLQRWVDFKSHQIFDEAITYTALQFFTADPNAAVEVIAAPNGADDVAEAVSGRVIPTLDYDRLPPGDPWLLATGEERALIDRLAESCLRLDDPSLTTHIFQGLITSADSIYHLTRLRAGRYRCTPKDGDPQNGVPHTPAYEVEIEDAIMKPLVSGAEAKRYEEPFTETYLLFPYERDAAERMKLISGETMGRRYPQAWAYLRSYEQELRGREGRAFDDDEWFRFGRNQSVDKQDEVKLVVAQTVPAMRVCMDTTGSKYLNNVRVNGILSPTETKLTYLLGALNAPVADYVFRRLGKPKQGGWYEANKQFIAPLPIPAADEQTQAEVGRAARSLQTFHSDRRDLFASVADRLSTLDRDTLRPAWLWPALTSVEDFEARAPRRLAVKRERRAWAQAQADAELEALRTAFAAALVRKDRLEARYADGELRLLSGGQPLLSRIYLDPPVGRLVEAYWRWLLLSGAARDAESFEKALRRPPLQPDTPAARQFVERVDRLAEADAEIEREETAMNLRLFDLYGLSPEERGLIERG